MEAADSQPGGGVEATIYTGADNKRSLSQNARLGGARAATQAAMAEQKAKAEPGRLSRMSPKVRSEQREGDAMRLAQEQMKNSRDIALSKNMTEANNLRNKQTIDLFAAMGEAAKSGDEETMALIRAKIDELNGVPPKPGQRPAKLPPGFGGLLTPKQKGLFDKTVYPPVAGII